MRVRSQPRFEQPGDHQQEILIRIRENARTLTKHRQRAEDLAGRGAQGDAEVAHDAQLLPHGQTSVRLAPGRVTDIGDRRRGLVLGGHEGRVERQPKAGCDGRPALDLCRQDLERVVVDLAVEGGPGIESPYQAGQRPVDQLEQRLIEVTDHQVAHEAERWLAIGTHERAPTVISLKWATIG